MKSRRRVRTANGSRWFNTILRYTLGLWLRVTFRVIPVNRELFRSVRPPFLLLANHACVWDPFIVNSLIPHPVHYVVTDAQFRSRLVKFGLSLVGGIRKTKAMSDMDSMKNIMRVKERGGVIGVFPEGQNTWDGHSLEVVPSTAKLAKLLRIPVVTARVVGAYFSLPRWAKKRRRGRVEVQFDLTLTPEELRSGSVDAVYARISQRLQHDETEYNREAKIQFRGPDRAEYLERTLFVCPSCKSISTLRSSGPELFCTECDLRVRFMLQGTFAPIHGTLPFDSIRRWNLWQVDELRTRLDAFVDAARNGPFFHDNGVDMQIGYRSRPLSPFRSGNLELHKDAVVLLSEDGNSEKFPVQNIRGANVQNNEHWEFYCGPALYRVTIRDPRGCTYKWDLAVRNLKSKKTRR